MRPLLARAALFALPLFLAGAAEFPPLVPKNVTEFKLANGMRFLVVERRQAPVAAFHLHVRAGHADAPNGKRGIALLMDASFEAGGETLGSRAPAAEKAAFLEAEKSVDAWDASRRAGTQGSRSVAEIQSEVRARLTIERLASLTFPSLYRAALQQQGASDLSIRSSADSADHRVTLPASRAELWFRVWSDWLRGPSWRLFYFNRAQIEAARRNSLNAQIEARLEEAVVSTALASSPYSKVAIGPEEAGRLRISDAEQFHKSMYHPSRLVVAVAGGVPASEIRRLAESYFGKLAAADAPAAQPAASTVAVEGRQFHHLNHSGAPLAVIAWPRPASSHPDAPVLELLHAVLSRSEEFNLEQELVSNSRTAARMRSIAAYPGDRFPSLFMLDAVLAPGRSIEDLEKGVDAFFARLREKPIDSQTVARAKSFVWNSLASNVEADAGMATLLANAALDYPSLEAYSARLAGLDAITPADLQRVARLYFGANRFVYHGAVRRPGGAD